MAAACPHPYMTCTGSGKLPLSPLPSPTMHDAHALLGLQPGASPPEIKRAFRKLAMRWHPDRNPDPAATEHFKALREAHDRLLDTLLGGDNEGDEAGASDAANAQGDAATAAASEPAPRGADRRETLDLSLEEACLGVRKPVCIHTPVACDQCDGNGIEQLSVSRLCEDCRGTGKLRHGKGLTRCHSCGGRGFRSTVPCAACAGSGTRNGERWLEVVVPPGLVDDDELRIAGEGEPHPDPQHLPGDLRLRVRLRPHPIFRRDGRDLLLRRPLSALRLLAGGEVAIPHPAGQRTVTLEPGSAAARSVRVAGAGFGARGKQPAGDLVIEFEPVLPQHGGAELRKAIDALEALLQRDPQRHLPELARWEREWLS